MIVVRPSLRQQLADTQARLRELQDSLRPLLIASPVLGLRQSQQRLLVALTKEEVCPKDVLLEATKKRDGAVGPQLLLVRICQMRQSLNTSEAIDLTGGPFVLHTLRGIGFSLDDRARWQDFIQRREPASEPMQVAA